jgi:hypothetical protein
MQKKTKRLIIIIAGIIVAGVVMGILALRYIPFHKFMKRPTSNDLAFISTGQSAERPPNSLYLDFEIDSTASVPGDLYKGIAHSGRFSSKTFGKNTFSVSFEKKIGEIRARNLKKVSLSAWVYVFPGNNDPEGALVFTITNTVGVNTCWKGVALNGPYIPRGEWFKISGSFDLDDVLVRDDDKVQIYFWNNSSTDILTDDFYVVFGAPEERRGDSTLVDMTRGSYQAGFNIAPYPPVFFEKESLEPGELKESDILPGDNLIPGFFANPAGDRESLLAISESGNAWLAFFCPELKGFRKIPVTLPSDLSGPMTASTILAGSFLPGGYDQILILNEKGFLLAGVEKISNPCSGEGAGTSLKILWRSDGAEINGIRFAPAQVTIADVNGDKRDELLVIRKGGTWELFGYKETKPGEGAWVTLASGDMERIREWDPATYDVKMTSGRFIRNVNKDLILSIYIDKTKHILRYSMHQYDPAGKKFSSRYSGWEGNPGKTIGVDTLKTSDRFFTGPFREGEADIILRYNRDWRYDLKMIEFNDTTFRIMASMDFSGYEKDFNPKFYEALRLLPGRWIDPGKCSMMVIAKNTKQKEYENLPYLPNSIQVYSLKK